MLVVLIFEVPGADLRRGCQCSANLLLCSSVIFCVTEIHQFIELQMLSEWFGRTQLLILRNGLERGSEKWPTSNSNCRLLVFYQCIQANAQNASSLSTAWDNQRLGNVQIHLYVTKLSNSIPVWVLEHMVERFDGYYLPPATLWISQHQTNIAKCLS